MRWLLLLALLAPAQAARLVVLPLEATNLGKAKVEAADFVLRAAFEDLTGAGQPRAGELRSALRDANAAAVARHHDARQYLRIHLVRLARQIELRATLHALDGRVLNRARASAYTLDALPVAAQRLAERSLGPQLEAEAKKPKADKAKATRTMGMRVGLIQPMLVGVDAEVSRMLSAGYVLRYDFERGYLEASAGLDLAQFSDARMDYMGPFLRLGGGAFFTKGDPGAYFGGGMRPRVLINEGEDLAIGLAPYGLLGLAFFREHSFTIFVEAEVSQHLTAIPRVRSTDEEREDAAKERPTEIGANVGVLW